MKRDVTTQNAFSIVLKRMGVGADGGDEVGAM